MPPNLPIWYPTISINDPAADTLDGLVTHIVQIAEETLLPLSIKLRLDAPLEIPGRPVSPEIREQVILVVSEALNNVVKHAEASTVGLRIRTEGGPFEVEIRDDGKGYSLDRQVVNDEHGLANIRKRAASLRGQLEIQSSPGQGTAIRLTLPRL